MPALPAFLLKPFVLPLALGVAVLSLLANAVLGLNLWAEKRHSGKLQTRVEALAGDNTTLKANNAALKTSLATQNMAVDALKTAAETAAAGARAGQAAAEAGAAASDLKAASLKNLPALPAGADHCAAASALIRSHLAGEKTK